MNTSIRCTITALWLLACGSSLAAPAEPAFRWPHGASAAVSLAYDDALDSQLDNAIPVLNRYGIKGSFYLQLSSASIGRRLLLWRAAAAQGHELGNHSLFHQCSRSAPGREWVQGHRDLDTMSTAQMRDQLIMANTVLHMIDGRRERTFTVPCGDVVTKDGNYLATVQSEFVAIKAGDASGKAASMNTLDPYAVPVIVPVNVSGQQLIAMVKQAGASGGMLNLTFHGIGGEHLAVSREAHEELVKFLAANRKHYWTDTFLNLMTYVKKVKAEKK